jgi:GT2 family glycosyltransferase
VSVSASVVVVSYRHPAAMVGELLRALASQTASPREVLLVDNAGDPELDELVGVVEVDLRVLRPEGNVGYVGGCNLAAREATGDWLWFVNPDAVPAPTALERLLAATDERTAIAGAQILLPDARVNAGDNPLHVSGLSWAGRYLQPREDVPPRDVAVSSGACLLVRRADFEGLGGYHHGYFLYHDDVDLAWRARLAGRRVLFVPEATAVHDYDFGKGAYKWFWLERNRLWTILSNYDARTLVLLAPVLLATELAVLAFAVRTGWWREKLRSWRELWRARHELRTWRTEVQSRRRVPDAVLLRDLTGRLDSPLLAAPGVGVAGAVMEAYRRAVVVALRMRG